MNETPLEHLTTLDRYMQSIVPALEHLAPNFNTETARAMDVAYNANGDFIGTPYENQPGMIKAFSLYREACRLAGMVDATVPFSLEKYGK